MFSAVSRDCRELKIAYGLVSQPAFHCAAPQNLLGKPSDKSSNIRRSIFRCAQCKTDRACRREPRIMWVQKESNVSAI
jgi:hypothetical protein